MHAVIEFLTSIGSRLQHTARGLAEVQRSVSKLTSAGPRDASEGAAAPDSTADSAAATKTTSAS